MVRRILVVVLVVASSMWPLTADAVLPCGDGIIQLGEACDDGNFLARDDCDPNCQRPGCGNGWLTSGEECDDGNLQSGDGCSSSCQEEAGCDGDMRGVWHLRGYCPRGLRGFDATLQIVGESPNGPYRVATDRPCESIDVRHFALQGPAFCEVGADALTARWGGDILRWGRGRSEAAYREWPNGLGGTSCNIGRVRATEVFTITPPYGSTRDCFASGTLWIDYDYFDVAGAFCVPGAFDHCSVYLERLEGVPGGSETMCLPGDSCDDGDPCTIDQCDEWRCAHTAESPLTENACRVTEAMTDACETPGVPARLRSRIDRYLAATGQQPSDRATAMGRAIRRRVDRIFGRGEMAATCVGPLITLLDERQALLAMSVEAGD